MQKTTCSKWGGIVLAFAAAAFAARAARSDAEPTRLREVYGLRPPSSLHPAHTALVLVDFQNEFVSGGLKLPAAGAAIAHAAELARWARQAGILVVLVENVIDRPGAPLFAAGAKNTEIVPQLRPQLSDLVLQKNMAGAFSHTDFDEQLRARGIDTLIVGGFMTHLAVLVTVIDASVRGYRVLVAADSTATRALPGSAGEPAVDAPTLHRAALATMSDRFADVLRGNQIMNLPLARP
jgi:nicotinamidase-related amidase